MNPYYNNYYNEAIDINVVATLIVVITTLGTVTTFNRVQSK